MKHTLIRCPNCAHEFPLEQVASEQYKQELREKLIDYQKKKDEEVAKRMQDLKIEFQEREKEARKILEEQLRNNLKWDYQNQLEMLARTNKENEERLRLAKEKEIEFLKKEQDLLNKQSELEVVLQRKFQDERKRLIDELQRIEELKFANKETEFQLRLKELEKQLDDQKKLAEEMRRKAEQRSTQLHGETQELLLEEILRSAFPLDSVLEVQKGIEGADCIMIVRNNTGDECGKIIFESKRTKTWSNSWLEKLKRDMRSEQADIAILVSQVYPKGMECFGEKDGVWIASFREVVHLTTALRTAIVRIAETKKYQENKGEKMEMLYSYLTGLEFRQHIEAVVEGFLAMKHTVNKERIQMEKLWKEREKQLEKVLLNTSGLYGAIKGIAGSSIPEIPLLEISTSDEEQIEQDRE